MTDAIKVYKCFNADWTCRDYQFKLGETFVHEGAAELCNSGFHACEYPLDIFNYYPPTGQIAECELSGLDAKLGDDSKRAGNKISVKFSLTIPMLITAAIEYTTSKCIPANAKHSDADRSASSATGDSSASSATGYSSASSATGDSSASSATGYRSASSATGGQAVAAAFGLYSKAKAGETGVIIVAWWDESVTPPRKRLSTGYVGEKKIKADTWYECDAKGKLVEVK